MSGKKTGGPGSASANGGDDFCEVRQGVKLFFFFFGVELFGFRMTISVDSSETDKHHKLELGPVIHEILKNVYTWCNHCYNLMVLLVP